MTTTTQETPMAIVTTPTSGDKVRAVRTAINFKRAQLDSLRNDSIDRASVRRELEALEAVLLDYQRAG